jgi:hypothetical protein
MTEVNQYPACRSPRTSVPGGHSPARAAASRQNNANATNRENPIEGNLATVIVTFKVKSPCYEIFQIRIFRSKEKICNK